MQSAKDSFYEELRNRLAGLNPGRTVVVRGVTRPALVVDENETGSVAALPECFHLRWTGCAVERNGPLVQVGLGCEIGYATAGVGLVGGLDRGRTMAAMDAELLAALTATPQRAQKQDFSGLVTGGVPVSMGTQLWWSDPSFGEVQSEANQVRRTVRLTVMAYAETGELG